MSSTSTPWRVSIFISRAMTVCSSACSVSSVGAAASVVALMDDQELDSRASTGAIYCEGLSELRTPAVARLGVGYLQMTGYAEKLRMT